MEADSYSTRTRWNREENFRFYCHMHIKVKPTTSVLFVVPSRNVIKVTTMVGDRVHPHLQPKKKNPHAGSFIQPV
jgi:hypothetical protein